MTIQADNFIARTSGFGPRRTAAVRALIDGLVGDGVWAKLDALYIPATLDTTTANLNLVSTSFTLTQGGAAAPTFTVDVGYYCPTATSDCFLQTGFAPSAAGGVYVQDSAHVSIWSVNTASGNFPAIDYNGSGAGVINVFPHFGGDDNFYGRINDAGNDAGVADTGSGQGFYLVTRTLSIVTQKYLNGVAIGAATTDVSNGLSTVGIVLLGRPSSGSGYTGSAMSIGGALTATDVTNLYNRLNTYMALLPFGPDAAVFQTAAAIIVGG